ncbi:uncharacterized protein LOC122062599 isoform X2 [Macadamia integrifolia]|uniref:uncharacterized protein LOC122062599 isoform X2 n=1 Tax=Macadamia integrifolia TaxID=60698 RepID=UPI001C4FB07C|nr:uncharacterized protein LOC122062599 isoform X2 [Macadamia integrifolia]
MQLHLASVDAFVVTATTAGTSEPGIGDNLEANGIQSFHPFSAHEFSLTDNGVIHEPMVLNNMDLSSSHSGKPDMANSFLALLSGSSPQLQCEFQLLSSSRSAMAATKLPEHDSNIAVSSAGFGVPITPIMAFNQLQGNGNMGNAAEFCPIVPSRTASTTNYGCPSPSYLRDNFQLANSNLQSSDYAKTGFDHAVCSNERGMNLRQGCPSANPGNSCLFNKTTIQSSPKFPSESKAVMLDSSSTFTRGHPLVFCLGKTGNLLLSNTGLLGVVCSCHNLHMSIAKFCGHSGLRTVNPGDAVCLESGETVAQWRRLYFHKLGIRVPDEHSEWDWPEEFSATGGLVKCRATVPNMSIKSDMFLPVDSVGGITRCGQTRNSFVSSRNPRTGQSVVEKSANTILHNAWQKNAQEGHNLVFNSLIGTSNSILPALAADGQILKENPMSRGLPLSNTAVNVGGQDSGYRSISDYVDLLKAGNLLTSDPSLESSKSLGIASDVRRCNNSLEGFVAGREAISSNIELRLGQPSQHSNTMGGSILSTEGPQPFNTLGDSQKAPYQGHVIHNMVNPWVTEGSRQNIYCMPLDTSNFNLREAESQLNFRNHALGNDNARDAVELSKGDADKNSLISTFLQHFRPPSYGAIQSQTANDMVNSVEHFLPRVPGGGSHVSKRNPTNLTWSRSDGTQKQLNSHWLGLHNHTDKGKGVILADNHPKFSVEGSSTFQGKHTADSSLFDGVIGGYCLPSSSAVLCSSYLGQSPGVLPDANKPSNLNGRVSFPRRDGQHDHAFLRSVHSFPVSAGPGIPLSTTSMGFSSATSISRPSPTPCLSSKEGSDVNQQLLDENLRLLLLRHMVELSKQEHGMAFQEMNPEQGRLHTPSGMGVQRKCSFQDPLTSEQIREGIYLTIKQDASEVKSLQSCSNCGLPGGIEKLADLAGTNSRSNFSTVAMQGSTLCSKDLGIQCLPSHDTVMHTNPLLRLGRIENNNIAASGDRAKCFHKELHTYFPEKCSCCVHSMCLAGSVSRGESSLGAYKEHIGSVDGKNSLLVASAFDKANVISQEKAVALGQCKNVKRQISVNEDCNDTQWNDVSCRVMGVRNGTCIRMPAEELDGRENVDQFLETASKGYIGASQEAELLKEQQMSNICSGCSAPAITEVSIEVNNMDSCTVDAGYVTDHIVDEGSGVEKCWSSDDALDSGRSAHTPIVTTKVDSTMGGSLVLPTQSSNADEIKMRNPLRLKKVSNKHTSRCAVHDNINHMKHFEKDLKTGKKKKAMKWKSLDASFPPSGLSSVQFKLPKCAGRTELHSCSSKEMHFSSQLPACGKHTSGSSSLKRKHSSMSSSKTLTQKRSRQGLDVHHRESEDDNQTQLKENSNLIEVPKLSGTKKAKWAGCENVSTQFQRQDMSHVETDKAAKYSSVECMKSLSSPHVDTCDKKKAKPIICGNSGIIFNEKLAEGLGKPPKIVALSVILKKAGRCTISENEKRALISMLETKKSKLRSKGCNSKVSVLKKERDNESKKTVINDDLGHGISMTETKKTCFSRNEDWVEELSMLQKEEDDEGHTERGDLRRLSSALGKPRFKETRRRSLYELTRRGKNPGSTKFCHTKVSKCTLQTKCRSYGELHLTDAEGSQERTGELGQVDAKKSIKDHNYLASVSESNAFCCVCGSSNKDEMNYLLECGRCYIRVHQACYGVTKVPKGCWSCRPCRTSSEHIVCVLCGYEGGAMTRAIRSRSAVKSLLKAWDTSNISKSENSNLLSKTLQDESGPLDALTSVNEADLVSTVRLKNSKPFPIAVLKMDLQNQMDDVNAKDGPSSNPRVHNTVTAGVLDPTIMQWVHMVCGLWTPGTRCPNVDTMSAFDVSGAQGSRKTIVCSMCYRPGGSCIQCRVANCSVQFHPWCAHQKGLLQSEVEGVDNEKVGFYGRCEIHATHYKCVREDHHVDTRTESPEQKDTTCARTEGYKGRRRDGFIHNHHGQSSDNGGCLVPQEQINAWLHINGQKSSTRGFLKPPASDVEYDCRVLSSCQKEYARYKQAKGWKHLVVYKSGIHALGLYTSRFISRGSMVVEYVGEIVGLRVADKRENDYQSGRKLQYKSACYFFRIDKEHIIDATRKGGIARFVNHSCLPNCVAKVISVRNEKKVVFFAERDINPGEEITYDYHFNHEDEGKKIPCFCNSKNCRRYLN